MRALLAACWLASLPLLGQALNDTAQEGLAAPEFRAAPVNGPAVTLGELVSPGGAVVAFADPRSREGQRLIVYLQIAVARLDELKVKLVVMALNYAVRDTVREFVKENSLSIPVAFDENRRVAELFSVETGAAAFVIGPDKVVVRRLDAGEQSPDIGPPMLSAVRQMEADLRAAASTGPQQPTAPTISEAEARQRIRAGWRLIQQGQLEAALDDARRLAEARGKGDFMGTLWLAYCLEAARAYPEAAVTYRKVLRIKPGHAYSLQALARIDPRGEYQTDDDLAPPEPEAPADEEAPPQLGPVPTPTLNE